LASNDGTGLTTYENNFGGITIDQNWGGSETYFDTNKNFYCSSKNHPNAVFDSFSDVVTMMVNRWSQRMSSLSDDSVSQISKFWILNENIANTEIRLNPINVYDKMSATDKANIESKVTKAIDLFKGSN
jgi:hypothetical protein